MNKSVATIRRNVRGAMKAKGMTIRATAEKMGMSERGLAKFLAHTDPSDMTLGKFIALASALEIAPEALFSNLYGA